MVRQPLKLLKSGDRSESPFLDQETRVEIILLSC